MLRFEYGFAIGTLIEMLTCIDWHRLSSMMTTLRTSND